MKSKSEILELVWKNKLVDEAIRNVVDGKWRDDFKSHLIIELSKKPEGELQQLLTKGVLDWFILRIITNQWRSTGSTFWKEWRNFGFHKANTIVHTDNIERFDYVDEEYIEVAELNEHIVKQLLRAQYEDFLQNQYHETLFTLYFFEGKTYREISAGTGINKDAISRSIRKTKLYLKNKIKGGYEKN